MLEIELEMRIGCRPSYWECVAESGFLNGFFNGFWNGLWKIGIGNDSREGVNNAFEKGFVGNAFSK